MSQYGSSSAPHKQNSGGSSQSSVRRSNAFGTSSQDSPSLHRGLRRHAGNVNTNVSVGIGPDSRADGGNIPSAGIQTFQQASSHGLNPLAFTVSPLNFNLVSLLIIYRHRSTKSQLTFKVS